MKKVLHHLLIVALLFCANQSFCMENTRNNVYNYDTVALPLQLSSINPLTENAVDDELEFETPLHRACGNNNLEKIKSLLNSQDKPNVNKTDLYDAAPLSIACENGNYKIAQLLLNHGANKAINSFDNCDETALHKACKSNKLNIVILLVKHNAKFTKKDIATTTNKKIKEYLKLTQKEKQQTKKDFSTRISFLLETNK